MYFKQINLSESLVKAITLLGYTTPTTIQQQSIEPILDGRDLIACAQTGTGKTAAFLIPILQHLQGAKLERNVTYAVVVVPTRELALQVATCCNELSEFTKITSAVVYGGVPIPRQVSALKKGCNILIATPGRLLDLINQKIVSLKNVQTLVLDEADMMLDLGFLKDIKRLIAYTPADRQTLLFSATIPTAIKSLANSILSEPLFIQAQVVSSTAEKVEQKVLHVAQKEKSKTLASMIVKEKWAQTIIFTRTKRGADKLVKFLKTTGIESAAIHGDKSQSAREKALREFKEQKINYLIATDIASRGIDIQNLPLVVNYDLPMTAEAYVHRIGRTGRAGKSGLAISFCDIEETSQLKAIEKLIGFKIPKQIIK